jgi:hypothetical protein
MLASFTPDPAPAREIGPDPSPFLMAMVAGFIVGVLGHLFRSRTLVVLGVVTVFASTFLLPLALFLSRS